MHALTGIPKDRTIWCGPSAISMLTGVGYGEVLDLLRLTTGRRTIKSVGQLAMIRALDSLGWTLRAEPIRARDRRTFAWWLRSRTREQRLRGSAFLVELTRHYVVVDGRWGGDNHTKVPVRLREMPHRRRLVKRVWRATRR